MQPILNVSNIEKYYGNKGMVTKAVDNISFSVNKGEFVGIMGASGSGKLPCSIVFPRLIPLLQDIFM